MTITGLSWESKKIIKGLRGNFERYKRSRPPQGTAARFGKHKERASASEAFVQEEVINDDTKRGGGTGIQHRDLE